MAVQKINYANKTQGDLWRTTDANQVKDVVNNNADVLSEHATAIQTMESSLSSMATQQSQNTAALQTLVSSNVKQVFLSQEEYDALVEDDSVESDVMYNIYE